MSRPPESTRPSIDLSLTQVIAASVGAAIATAITGAMRLAGTLLGAVLVTVVATIATAVVSLWLRRSRQRMLTIRAPAAPDTAGPATPEPAVPRSPRSRPVLAGLVGGVVAAALLAATGHPVLSLRVDANALDEIQRWLHGAAEHVETWAAGG